MDGCPGFKYFSLVQLAGAGVGDSWESFGWLPTQQGCGCGQPWESVVGYIMFLGLIMSCVIFWKQDYM